jgi:hypothetical protein
MMSEGSGKPDKKLTSTFRDIGRASLFAWMCAIVLAMVWSAVGNKSISDAFVPAAFLVAAAFVGQGIFGLGGGQISWSDPISRAARRRNRNRESMSGALTPFGIALLVAPQLVLASFFVSYLARD